MGNCLFCKIVKNEIPCIKIFESKNAMAFLDIAPAAKGHVLVIPKKHFETLLDVPKKDLEETIAVVQAVAEEIVSLTQADGFNVLQSNKPAAGQVVPHLHFHIIPRKQGDALHLNWQRIEHDKEEMQAWGKLLQEKLMKNKKRKK